MSPPPDGTGSSRVVVLIDDHPKTPTLLRAAARFASACGKPWIALHVTTPTARRTDHEARERLDRFSALAKQLGGRFAAIESRDVAKGLQAFLDKSPSSGREDIFVGRNERDGLFVALRSGLGEHLIRRFRSRASIHIVPLTGDGGLLRWWSRDAFRQTRGSGILGAIAAVGIAYVLTELLDRLIRDLEGFNPYATPVIFLVACMFAASRIGILAGIVATGLSTAAMVHFHMRGDTGLAFTRPGDFLNVALLAGAASLITIFAGYTRANAEGALRREKRTQALFKINRLTANAQSREEALSILHETLTELLDMQVAYFLPPALNPEELVPAYPANVVLDSAAQEALAECWSESSITGFGTAYSRQTNWRFEPLVTPSGEIGVMGLQIPSRMTFDSSFGRLLSALADHSAAILERVELARSSEATRIVEAREKLRSMLLSSVSHDLKTPLASVIGSLSVYQTMKSTLPVERSELLIRTALDEAQRLDSFISNILDMTRLESGDLRAKPEWTEPFDLLHRVKKRMRQKLQRHRVEIEPFEDSIEVHLDVMLTEQVLQNLLDNAAKYSPADSEITVTIEHDENELRYLIRDRGKGIPPGKEDAIFDKYSRLKREDSQVAGTGLGLAIGRAIMAQQAGQIDVYNHPEGGAVFVLHFTRIRKIDAGSNLLVE